VNCVNSHRKDHSKKTTMAVDLKLIDKLLAD
jgi:hypothetical protein